MAENFSTSSATPGATEPTDLMPEVNVSKTPANALDSGNMDAAAADKLDSAVTAAASGKTWDEEFIKDVVNRTVDEVIQNASYSHEATSMWVNSIVEIVVRALVKVDRDNKYIVTCMIVQNLRQGMRSATSCYWSSRTDSGYSLTNERNGMYVITTVFICQP